MDDSIRVRTNVGDNGYLPFQLKQNFDFIEILSLKLRQDDVYRLFASTYGVITGRVIVNAGFGVPNARVSVFIPIKDIDKDNVLKSSLYPFENINDKDSDGIRYTLLPKKSNFDCHTPVGNLPNKREFLDNDVMVDIYQDYYKFTTRTNDAGDFMLFGVPVGTWKINLDVDLSDIGFISQKPYDFIRQGRPIEEFDHVNKFKSSNTLKDLPQIFHTESSVNVLPFWGDVDNYEVGLNRLDLEIEHRIEPQAFFIGSIFGDNEKNSVSKICLVRGGVGNLCETVANQGTIEMIRKTPDGKIEPFDVKGGRVIDENGTWAYQIPMNLDYYITDEFGKLIKTEDRTKGIPTRADVRFRISMDNSGEEGKQRRRAKYLVPNNPEGDLEGNYDFNENTPNNFFVSLHWNKIYTVKNFISRFQDSCMTKLCGTSRRFVGVKDVDDCGDHTPFPFNRLDGDINPVFTILCVIMTIISTIVAMLNRWVLRLVNILFSWVGNFIWKIAKYTCDLLASIPLLKLGGAKCRKTWCGYITITTPSDVGSCSGTDFSGCDDDDDECYNCNTDLALSYITSNCGEKVYFPWSFLSNHNEDTCYDLDDDGAQQYFCTCLNPNTEVRVSKYIECQQIRLAEKLNVFEFDFYNDWINGTLYSFLFRQKLRREGEGKNKFCDYNCDEFPNPTNNNPDDGDPSDNSCQRNWITDTGCEEGDEFYEISGDRVHANTSKAMIKDGVIKLYEGEYYYAAVNHYGVPMFKTDLVLLGSINPCDIHGIPLIYDNIKKTTYNRPPTSEVTVNIDGDPVITTSNIEGLLFGLTCAGITTTNVQMYNIKKICEIGVGQDEVREDEGTTPNDIIGNEDIDDEFIRNAFILLNENNINNIDSISEHYSNNILSYDTNFGNRSPVLGSNTTGDNYLPFRDFKGGDGSPRLPFGGSLYFYFGIDPKNTAIDKFYENFAKECRVFNTYDLILEVDTYPTTDIGSGDGRLNIDFINGVEPFKLNILFPDGNVNTYNDVYSPYTLDGLNRGNYVINAMDNAGEEGKINAFINGASEIDFFVETIDTTSYNSNDGILNVYNVTGGVGDEYEGTITYLDVNSETPSVQTINFIMDSSVNNRSFNNLPATKYSVFIEDSANNSEEKQIFIYRSDKLKISCTLADPVDCVSRIGDFIVNISGGEKPYDFGITGLTNLREYDKQIVRGIPQRYKISATSQDDQTEIIYYELEDIDNPMNANIYYNSPCHDSDTGYIRILSIDGGTPPYEYGWRNAGEYIHGGGYGYSEVISTDNRIDNLSAYTNGTAYILSVTDSLGCHIRRDIILYNSPPLNLTLWESYNLLSARATLPIKGNTVSAEGRFYLKDSDTNIVIDISPVYGPDSSGYITHQFKISEGNYEVRVLTTKNCEEIKTIEI